MRLRLCLLAATAAIAAPLLAAVEKPAAIVADGIPPVPDELASRTRPYMEFRTASFQGWNPANKGLAITTRFGNVPQVHEVARPGPTAARSPSNPMRSAAQAMRASSAT
jgi:hypothetical protein